MKLITYYGKLEPKSLFRVIVDGDKVQGYVSTPDSPQWKKSGAVVTEIASLSGHEALPISTDEASMVLTAWGGTFDARDAVQPEPEPKPQPVVDYEAELFEEFGEDLLLAPAEVEVLTIDELQPVAAIQEAQPPSPEPVWAARADVVTETFDLWEPPAPVFAPVAIEQHVVETPMAPPPAPRVEPVTVHFDATEEEAGSERDVKLNRLDAISALRDLADGLTSLGRPGVGWA